MTDVTDVLDVRLTARPGTDGPAAGIGSEVPAGARSPSPEPADSPVPRQLPRDLVLRALL